MSEWDVYLQRITKPRKQRRKPTFKEKWKYFVFWTLAASSAGLPVGFLSFLKRRSYRRWVLSLSPKRQMELLRENSGLQNQPANTTPRSRFSTLPHAMDTRRSLPWTGDFKTHAVWELGPIKVWNAHSSYPWFSELMVELSKWSMRMALLTGFTLFLDCTFTPMLGYRLGCNPTLMGLYGTLSGMTIVRVASLGMLGWPPTLMLSVMFGSVYFGLSMNYNDSYRSAIENHTWLAMYLPRINEVVEERDAQSATLYELHMYEMYLVRKGLLEAIEEDPSIYDDLPSLHKSLVNADEKQWADKLSKYTRGSSKFSEEIMALTSQERKDMTKETVAAVIGLSDERFPLSMMPKREEPVWVPMDLRNTGRLLTTDDDSDTSSILLLS